MDDVIPVPMKVRTLQLDSGQIGIRDLNASRIGVCVQLALNLQAFRGGRVGNQIHDNLVADERATPPVLCDVAE